MLRRITLGVLVVGSLVACSGSQGASREEGRVAMPSRRIDDVIAAPTDSLMAVTGVVGTTIASCDGERCIKVLLADSSPDTKSRIPARLEGYRVVVEVTVLSDLTKNSLVGRTMGALTTK